MHPKKRQQLHRLFLIEAGSAAGYDSLRPNMCAPAPLMLTLGVIDAHVGSVFPNVKRRPGYVVGRMGRGRPAEPRPDDEPS
jgi:hypothetical protein